MDALHCTTCTARLTSSRMKDLCHKWKVKLIFFKCLVAWPDWPDPHILQHIYATGISSSRLTCLWYRGTPHILSALLCSRCKYSYKQKMAGILLVAASQASLITSETPENKKKIHKSMHRLGGRVVGTLDLRSTGREFESQPPCCRVQLWASC